MALRGQEINRIKLVFIKHYHYRRYDTEHNELYLLNSSLACLSVHTCETVTVKNFTKSTVFFIDWTSLLNHNDKHTIINEQKILRFQNLEEYRGFLLGTH